MELQARLHSDMINALKSGEKAKLSVIRMLLSDVQNIDLAPKPITAEETVAAYGKKLRKSREEYQKLGKTPEVSQLDFEIGVVDAYLPKKASADETQKLVDAFLSAHSFTPMQTGQAMGAFMKAHGAAVDPAVVNPMIRKKLGSASA